MVWEASVGSHTLPTLGSPADRCLITASAQRKPVSLLRQQFPVLAGKRNCSQKIPQYKTLTALQSALSHKVRMRINKNCKLLPLAIFFKPGSSLNKSHISGLKERFFSLSRVWLLSYALTSRHRETSDLWPGPFVSQKYVQVKKRLCKFSNAEISLLHEVYRKIIYHNAVESRGLAGGSLILYRPKTWALALGLIYLGIDWFLCGLF